MRSLERGVTEVWWKGRVEDVRGIRGIALGYSFTLRTLTDDNSGTKDFGNTCGGSFEHLGSQLIDILDLDDLLIVVAELPSVKRGISKYLWTERLSRYPWARRQGIGGGFRFQPVLQAGPSKRPTRMVCWKLS